MVELLEGEEALVLEVSGPRSALQQDQYGEPGRRAAEIHLIPLLDEEGGGRLHPELLRLGLVGLE